VKKSKAEKLFSKYIRKWVNKTWLGWWKIDIIYLGFKKYSELDVKDAYHSVALCHTDWKYLTATIYVNSKVLKNCDDIEYIAVHELMHIFLNETQEDGIEHEERVATILARSFIFLNNQKVKKNE